MPHNLASFKITVRVPGDNRSLVESKALIEQKLREVQEIPGVTVDHPGGAMMILTNPEPLK
jgi:hypothetical protein